MQRGETPYKQIDSTEYKEFLNDSTYTEIRIDERNGYKEPPMSINILVTTVFIAIGIIVMITRPKHN